MCFSIVASKLHIRYRGAPWGERSERYGAIADLSRGLYTGTGHPAGTALLLSPELIIFTLYYCVSVRMCRLALMWGYWAGFMRSRTRAQRPRSTSCLPLLAMQQVTTQHSLSSQSLSYIKTVCMIMYSIRWWQSRCYRSSATGRHTRHSLPPRADRGPALAPVLQEDGGGRGRE